MKKIVLSAFLVLVILTASFYILMPGKVKIDFQETRTKYSVWENDGWVLAATEYINLFDGSAKMRANDRSISQHVEGNFLYLDRFAYYKDNIIVKDRLVFNAYNYDVTSFPIDHIIICLNCEGKILQFEYRDILYLGDTQVISSPFSFGHHMKLEWQDGSYYSKVFQNKVASDKIRIRYRPKEDVEEYHVRLFDPPDTVTMTAPDDLYNNDTDLQHSILFNCSIDFNATRMDLYLSNYTNGTIVLNQTDWRHGNDTDNNWSSWTVNLPTGDYTWACTGTNNSSSVLWSANRSILINTTGVNHTFQNLTSLGFDVNYSLLNWSAIINSTNVLSGNFSWNFTELNVTPHNFTDYLWVVENTGYNNATVYLNKSEDLHWYELTCNEFNITTTKVNVFNLTRYAIDYINCTLSLYNVSQAYSNWTLDRDNASFNFTYDIVGEDT